MRHKFSVYGAIRGKILIEILSCMWYSKPRGVKEVVELEYTEVFGQIRC